MDKIFFRLEKMKGFKKSKCIYILIKNEIPIYVGKTDNLIMRISAHLYGNREKRKDFDDVSFFKVKDVENINELEKQVINNLKEKFILENIQYN